MSRFLSSVYDPPSSSPRFYEREDPELKKDVLTNVVMRELINAIPYDNKLRNSVIDPAIGYFNDALAKFTPDYKSVQDREKLFRTYRPYAYPHIFSAAKGALYHAIGKSTPPDLDSAGDYAMQEEAWRKALGLPTKSKYIVPQTKYRPLNEKNPNSKYYKLGGDIVDYNLLREEIKKRKIKPGEKVEMWSLAPFIKKEVLDDYFAKRPKEFAKMTDPIEYFSQLDPIQGFQLGVNSKGDPYIYDIYDFDFAPLTKVTKPYEYEFYDQFPMNPFNVYSPKNKR
jgi:hypothetical protein